MTVAQGRHALAELRARPRHLALISLIVGLLAGPHGVDAALAAAALAAGLGGRASLAVVAAAAVLLGAGVGHARAAALGHTALRPLFGLETGARATVLELPREGPWDTSAMVRLESGPGRGERVFLTAPKTARWPADPVGAEVAVRGALGPLRDWEAFAAVRGAHAELAGTALRATGGRRGGLAGFVDGVRRRADHALTSALPRREGALLRGMALGEDQALPGDVRDDFRASGLGHIVAASGQNVALLAALAVPLLALAGLPLRLRLLALLGLVALYVPLAGGGPSIQRAGVMAAAGIAAALAGRPRSRWYVLGLAAAVTLVLDPGATGDVGWQLSFAAVAGILALGPRMAAALERGRVPPPLAQGLALTAAPTLATAPLLAHHFGTVSLVSLPVNLRRGAGRGGGHVGGDGRGRRRPGGERRGRARRPARRAGARLPRVAGPRRGRAAARHRRVHLGSPWLVATVYAAIAALFVLPRLRRPAALCAVPAAAGALAWPAAAAPAVPAGGARVEFLDIGQGDATLIQAAGHAVLVDAGPEDGPVVARLKAADVGRLDLAVVTHDAADHEGGMPAVLDGHPVGLLLDGATGARTAEHRRLIAAAVRHHVRRVAPDAGERLDAGPIHLQVLWPEAEPAALHRGEDPNLRAVVARVTVDGASMLLTADAESDVTAPLDPAPVDVLKVAHHGSDDPGLPDLLDRLHPSLAVIEVGKDNSYGHPTPSTLAALRAVPTVRRTDEDGTVVLTVDHGRMRVGSAP